ncbi:O-succinylbenzoic acid--CoA ligase [Sphaerisporangium melleum]|nr:O-succinylbenzoic acid--CoA ligase [Sphaerisporangium melleum]
MHAVVLPPGPSLFGMIRDAVRGEGPAVLPLAPDLPAPALREALSALRPTHVATADGVRRHAGGVPAAGDTAVIIATSGSTGVPKGVELAASALTTAAAASLDRLGARPGERWLCCLPVSHVSGLMVLVRSLLGGTEPLMHERFSPEAVAGSGADHVSLVPTQLRRMLDAGAGLSRFRTILLGGAAAPEGLLAEARDAGARVVTTYGMSETCGGCVYDGVPLTGVRTAVGADGRVLLAGPALFSGYRLRPDLTREALREGWYVTSDLGALENGRLRVLGRADDVINTGGRKVVSAQVAAILTGHPGVGEAVVAGRPHPEWGEEVVAVVVAADPAAPPALEELRALVKTRMPGYAAPRVLVLRDRLPLLPNGKHDLVAIRRDISGFVGASDVS